MKYISKTALLLLLVLAMHVAFKALDAATIPFLRHDSGITLLSASGNQNRYADFRKAELVPQWQPAKAWTGFITPADRFDPGLIQDNLNAHDIHPPLYFWIVGYLLHLTGSYERTLFATNITASTGALLLFYLMMTPIVGRDYALTGTAMFAFLPQIAAPWMALRPYELLMFAAVATGLIATRYLASRRPVQRALWLTGLFAAFLGGLMTHGYFVLLIAAVVLAGATQDRRLGTFMVFGVLGALAIGLFLALNSGFIDAYLRHRNMVEIEANPALTFRVQMVFGSWGQLFGVNLALTMGVVLALAVWALFATWARPGFLRGAPPAVFLMAVYAIVLALFLGQYLSANAPDHSIGGRYFYMILPFFMATITFLWVSYGAAQKARGIVFALLAITCATTVQVLGDRQSVNRELDAALQTADKVFINNPARGLIVAALTFLEDRHEILVTEGPLDDAKLSDLLAPLGPGDLVYMVPGHEVDEALYYKQRALLAQRFDLHQIPGTNFTALRSPP